jgi:hypothetical protein
MQGATGRPPANPMCAQVQTGAMRGLDPESIAAVAHGGKRSQAHEPSSIQ